MANTNIPITFNRAKQDKIDTNNIELEYSNGKFIVTEQGNIYVDFPSDQGGRIKISDIQHTSNMHTNISNPIKNKLYICSDGLFYYYNGKFNKLGGDPSTILRTTDTFSPNLDNICNISKDNITSNNASLNINNAGESIIGYIIIDKSYNIGVISAYENSQYTVRLSGNNNVDLYNKNTIYFDSSYQGTNGNGTRNKPYKDISTFMTDIYENDKTDINNKSLYIIYSNSILKLEDTHINNKLIMYVNILSQTINNNLSNSNGYNYIYNNFYNITYTIDNNSNFVDCTFNNCNINITSNFSCQYCTFNNCNINITGVYKTELHNYCTFNNCTGNLQFEVYDNTSGTNGQININNCEFNTLTLRDNSNAYRGLVYINNSHFNTIEINLPKSRLVDLRSGSVNVINGTIISENINLGSFNFNNQISTKSMNKINESKNDLTKSGLISNQIYDNKSRTGYTATGSLNLHLDAISNKFKTIDESLSHYDGDFESVTDSFVSKGIFDSTLGIEKDYKVGSVLKYIDSTNVIYNKKYNVSFKSYDSTNNKLISKLENAGYYCKPYRDYLDVKYKEVEIPNNIQYITIDHTEENPEGVLYVHCDSIPEENPDKYYMFKDPNGAFDPNSSNYKISPQGEYTYICIKNGSYEEDISSPVFIDPTNNNRYISGAAVEVIFTYLTNRFVLHWNSSNWEQLDCKKDVDYRFLITSVDNEGNIHCNTTGTTLSSFSRDYTITFTHNIELFQNDRIIRLSNGWDKLNSSNDLDVVDAINVDLNKLLDNSIYACLQYDDGQNKLSSNTALYNYPPTNSVNSTTREMKGTLYNFKTSGGYTQNFIGGSGKIYTRYINNDNGVLTFNPWITYITDTEKSIQTKHLNDKVVTNNKIATDAITSDKIKNLTIKNEDVANNTIAKEKLNSELNKAIFHEVALEKTTLTGSEPKGTMQIIVYDEGDILTTKNIKSVSYKYETATITKPDNHKDLFFTFTFKPKYSFNILKLNGKEISMNYDKTLYSFSFETNRADSEEVGGTFICVVLYIPENADPYITVSTESNIKGNINHIILKSISSYIYQNISQGRSKNIDMSVSWTNK